MPIWGKPSFRGSMRDIPGRAIQLTECQRLSLSENNICRDVKTLSLYGEHRFSKMEIGVKGQTGRSRKLPPDLADFDTAAHGVPRLLRAQNPVAGHWDHALFGIEIEAAAVQSFCQHTTEWADEGDTMLSCCDDRPPVLRI